MFEMTKEVILAERIPVKRKKYPVKMNTKTEVELTKLLIGSPLTVHDIESILNEVKFPIPCRIEWSRDNSFLIFREEKFLANMELLGKTSISFSQGEEKVVYDIKEDKEEVFLQRRV